MNRATTALAVALVLLAFFLPNNLERLTPATLVRIPVEAVLALALLLGLRSRPRKAAAAFAGVGLGLLTVLKCVDMGFYAVLDRPFDLLLDWELFGSAATMLEASIGRAGAIGVVIGVVALAVAVPILMTLAVVRISRLVIRHRAPAARATWVLGVAWIAALALGAQFAGVPTASMSTANLVRNRVHQVSSGLKEQRTFTGKVAVDAFAGTPSDRLLTGLRGKDVIFAFVESYGRNAIENSQMAPGVNAVLSDGTRRLREAGYSSRSGFLTSPVHGAGSWLAHSTFLSGMWVKNQRRYGILTASDRLTLTSAFKRTGAWRTVGIVPGVTEAWPEGRFFGLDNIYDSRQLGYHGPAFGWSPVPDQVSLSAFERLEHGKRDRTPLMAEIILTSSHHPWAPIPKMIGWDQVGDRSVYEAMNKAGKRSAEVWRDPVQVRTEYGRAIEYSLNALISYVEKHGDDDTVLVFLGDHEPVRTVTGKDPGRDVPIAIVARDRAVMDRISGWGWQDGLKPGPDAPVWRMDAFRDRFLTAYGPPSDSR